MTSFLVVSQNTTDALQFVTTLCEKENIQPIDRTVIEKSVNEGLKTTQGIGIEEIKLMQQKLYLKPIKSPTKAVILRDAELLTIPAQNALLKILEEPPEHTIIILSVKTKEALLPTVLSRCNIIDLQTPKKELTAEERRLFDDFFSRFASFSIADALEYAESIGKNKEESIVWLERAIHVGREHLLNAVKRKDEQKEKELLIVLSQLQKSHRVITTTNTNPRLTLEILFLSLTNTNRS